MALPTSDSEARLFGEWQGRVTQALENLKEAIEKLEEDRTTKRDYDNLYQKVTSLQGTVTDLPSVIQKAVTTAYQQAESSFNQRITDLGMLDLRKKVDQTSTDVATQKEAIETLKNTALRYGLAGGGIPTAIAILAAIIYFLVTGKPPPTMAP